MLRGSRLRLLIALGAAVGSPPGLAAAQAAAFPQFVNKTSQSLEFSGVLQPRFEYTNQKDAAGRAIVGNNTFRLRRVEVYIKPTLSPRLKSTIGMDVVPTAVTLKDVYLDYLVSSKGCMTLRMGHWKKPYSREELRSSGAILMVDRGRTSDLFGPSGLAYQERDMGVALLGDFYEARVPVTYQVGIFNGNGANQSTDADSRKNYVGRVEVVPVPGLSLGANFSLNDLGVKQLTADSLSYPGNDDSFMAKAYGVDLKYQKRGLTVESELRSGDNWRKDTTRNGSSVSLVDKARKARGMYATAVYRMPTGRNLLPFVEPGFRAEIFDPNTDADKDGSTYFTPYLGLYPNENGRLQLNAVIEKPQPSGADNIITYVAQWTIRY